MFTAGDIYDYYEVGYFYDDAPETTTTGTIQIPGMCHILGFYDQFLPRDARSAIVSRPSVCLSVHLCRG